MGYGRRANKKRRNGRNNQANNNNDNKANNNRDTPQGNGSNYVSTIVSHGNFKFEAYYAAQGLHDSRWNDQGKLVPCETNEEKEAERQAWRTTISKTLSSSFRIGEDVPVALREQMETELTELLEAAKKTTNDEVVHKLGFLPHAFQLALDRTKIRKTPELEPLHNWLKQQTGSGFISRQETVSMIPPVILGPQQGDWILDMCAAPGSKTAQLLEAQGPDTGCLVANDASSSRAHMLVSQLRRIMHVNPSVMITCCDAQFFPAVTQFDRILADVPCSGDGTSRKNIGIWKTWAQTGALGLHKMQCDIAWKGASNLLKVGGHLCYSTCSHNPLENEAVVAEMLRRGNGSLELVEISLDDFRTRPGWLTWKVFCESKSRREIRESQKKTSNVFVNTQPRDDAVAAAAVKKDDSNEDSIAGKDEHESNVADTAKDEPDGAVVDAVMQAETEQVADVKTEAVDGAVEPPATVAEDEGKAAAEDADVAKTFRKYEPKTWDEANLMEMATSSGLMHLENLEAIPKRMLDRFRPSCFPPTKEEADRFNLERCIRCLPQDNDTGGFFVALLRKVGPIGSKETKKVAAESQGGPDAKRAKLEDDVNAEDSVEQNDADTNTDEVDEGDKPARGHTKGYFIRGKDGRKHEKLGKDDFVPVDDEILLSLIDFYGLSSADGFPKELFMTRAGGASKIIYFIANGVKELIDIGLQDRITVVNSGLKSFVRNNKECDCTYRIAQEGVHFLLPYITKRKFVINLDDFKKCMTGEVAALAGFSEEFQEGARPVSVGSFVVILAGFEEDHTRKMVMTVSDLNDKIESDVTNQLSN
jgi:16S rRNA C967 or C1407 C5-methylase (RsmB/RsmF family)